jgi:hypothetical protein
VDDFTDSFTRISVIMATKLAARKRSTGVAITKGPAYGRQKASTADDHERQEPPQTASSRMPADNAAVCQIPHIFGLARLGIEKAHTGLIIQGKVRGVIQ